LAAMSESPVWVRLGRNTLPTLPPLQGSWLALEALRSGEAGTCPPLSPRAQRRAGCAGEAQYVSIELNCCGRRRYAAAEYRSARRYRVEIYRPNGMSQKLLPAKENKTREIISRGRGEGPGQTLQPSEVRMVKCLKTGRNSGGSLLPYRLHPFLPPRAVSAFPPPHPRANNSPTIETSRELRRRVRSERPLLPGVVFSGSSCHRNGKELLREEGAIRGGSGR
jgi:hypothetical protein